MQASVLFCDRRVRFVDPQPASLRERRPSPLASPYGRISGVAEGGVPDVGLGESIGLR